MVGEVDRRGFFFALASGERWLAIALAIFFSRPALSWSPSCFFLWVALDLCFFGNRQNEGDAVGDEEGDRRGDCERGEQELGVGVCFTTIMFSCWLRDSESD